MPTKKPKAQIWPCETVTFDGKEYYQFPMPDLSDLTVAARIGTKKEAQRFAKSKAQAWARRTFPEAFAGL